MKKPIISYGFCNLHHKQILITQVEIRFGNKLRLKIDKNRQISVHDMIKIPFFLMFVEN